MCVSQLDKSHWNYQLYLWNDAFNAKEPKWKVIKTHIWGKIQLESGETDGRRM